MLTFIHWFLTLVFTFYMVFVPAAINQIQTEHREDIYRSRGMAVFFWLWATSTIAAYVFAFYAMLTF